MATGFKDVKVRGLGGVLDTRAEPDEVGLSNFRVLLNASTRARNNKSRRGGWQRLYVGVNDEYNNEDLHDQLLSLSFYYDQLSQVISSPGEFTGQWQYPYFFPGSSIPPFTTVDDVEIVYAYAPDFFGTYDFPIDDEGYGIKGGFFVGYPYAFEIDTTPDDGINAGPPDYYALSEFVLSYAQTFPGESEASYFWGTPSPVYSEAQNYLYEYCGTYPYQHTSCKESITYLNSIGMASINVFKSGLVSIRCLIVFGLYIKASLLRFHLNVKQF
jgi:hypothetical protein